MANRTLRVAIIGGGIGGMTAAAALHQKGIEVQVYERASTLSEVGFGLQMGPNAIKVARAIGIIDELRQKAVEPTNFASVTWDTATLRYRNQWEGVMEPRFGAPYMMAHRPDLHQLLISRVPSSSIHLDMSCVSCTNTNDGAVARFAGGQEVEADVIIGADGIHSNVRRTLFGSTTPRFTQQICWRAMVPIEYFPTAVGPDRSVKLQPSEYVGWIGPTGHVIFYPVSGGKFLNIFAGRVSETWVDESWSVPSSREEMLDAYAGWNEALLNVFRRIETCYKWGIYDRDPLASWVDGRIALLGDAAHPMMPTLAQGAAQSMEDGCAIARILAEHAHDPLVGLQAYNRERQPRGKRVQLQAREQFQNNRKPVAPPNISVDWIYEHDASTGLAHAAN
ncbi:MAG: FAD-dependent monooxygenase [Bradyrhizobium sp.]